MGTSNSKKLQENKRIYSTFLMLVKIVMKHKYIWEKTYNIEITLEQIYKDFITEKNYEKGFIIKWYFNKKCIEINSTKLREFLELNNISNYSTIEFEQEINELNENKNSIEPLDYIAIPYINPFKILIYNIKQKTNNIQKFEDDSIINNEQIKFGVESVYCNGGNHFFIFGGINTKTKEELGMFLDINLLRGKIEYQINITPKKRNHGMIYNLKKVYIVGGNDQKTLYYDSDDQKIENLGNLNIKRFEPSLIIHSNYLYCFDSTRNPENKYSFEKINLKEKSSWEIIYPKISNELLENIYNQKYFGIVEDNNYNIIFIGGLYANNNSEKIGDDSTIFNIKYNLLHNTMEKSDIPFQEINFSEKSLLPLNENEYIILLISLSKNLKLIEYYRDTNNIKITEVNAPNKEQDNSSIKKSTCINNNNLLEIDLDMPGTNIKKSGLKINNVDLNKNKEKIIKVKENEIINNEEENKINNEINENKEDKINSIIKKDNLIEINNKQNNEEIKNDFPGLEINNKPKEINNDNNKILDISPINNENIHNEINKIQNEDIITNDNIKTIVKEKICDKIEYNLNPNKEYNPNTKILNDAENTNIANNNKDKNQNLFETDFITNKKIKKKEREIIKNNLNEVEENY